MAMSKKDDPSTKSAAYCEMEGKWCLINSLLGGTDSMRAAGEIYLPRHNEESPNQYTKRLNVSTLANYVELTLEQLVGRVFAHPINFAEDVHEKIAALAHDVDGQGSDLTTFFRKLFREGFAKGFSHIIVDYPEEVAVTNPDGTPRPLSEAEARDMGRRPYWRLVCPENVIFAHHENVGGVERLVHVRILEEEVFMDGFAQVFRQTIRVIEPGQWSTYILSDKKKWVLNKKGTYDLPHIPMLTYYTNKLAPMVAKPPLTDLAHLNVAHWQSGSDQRNCLTVARFPLLAVSGALNENEAGNQVLAIGPNQWLHSPDANTKFYYVEHTGAAISTGQVDLEKLESHMAAYGAAFLKRMPGNSTATARTLDSAESISSLEAMAIDFKNFVEQVMQLTGEWLGLKPKEVGNIRMTTALDEGEDHLGDLETLTKARALGDISRRTYLAELQRRHLLDEDLDIEEELSAVEAETKEKVENDLDVMETEAEITAKHAPKPAPGKGQPL